MTEPISLTFTRRILQVAHPALRVGMRFTRYLGDSPLDWADDSLLEECQKLLETNQQKIEDARISEGFLPTKTSLMDAKRLG